MQARDRLGEPLGLVGGRASPCWRTATAWPGGRSRWPAGGRGRRCSCWSRRKPCRRVGCAREQRRAASSSVDAGRRRARGRRAASCASGSPLDDPHAGLALGAGLGEQQGPAVGEHPAGEAAPGLGRLLLVGLQPAALHEVDDEGGRRRSRAAGACPGGRRRRAAWPTAASGVGRDGLQRGERERPELARARRRRSRRRAARRGPGPRAARASVLRARRARPRTRPRRRRRSPWWVISSSTSPPTRSWPIMNAVWADSSPRPMAAAVVVALA